MGKKEREGREMASWEKSEGKKGWGKRERGQDLTESYFNPFCTCINLTGHVTIRISVPVLPSTRHQESNKTPFPF